MAERPDGLTIVFKRLCRYGQPGEVKTITYSTADRLCIAGYAERYVAPPADVPSFLSQNPMPLTPPPSALLPPLLDAQTFVLVSKTNGCGLQQDHEILKKHLEDAGKKVWVEQGHGDPNPTYRHVDVVIFLEIIDMKWFNYGKQYWAIPNSEWWHVGWDVCIPRLDRILCKTHDGWRLWKSRVPCPERVEFLGFESRDLYDPAIKRERKFLHLAGGSINKGSQAVLRAWHGFHMPYELVVVGANCGVSGPLLSQPNVNWQRRVSAQELSRLLNECQFHICPSRYEGWGHVLHEGVGCGAVMLTTAAAPMNELTGLYAPIQIPVDSVDHLRVPNDPRDRSLTFADMKNVSYQAVGAAVAAAAALNDAEISEISRAAREGFLVDRAIFREKLLGVINA